MHHERHYTPGEANAALGWVKERLDAMRTARDRLTDEDARKALSEATPGDGGGAPGLVVSQGFLVLQAALAELQAAEVVVRDLDRGLVDFPAILDGREVYLCWLDGEEQIGFWHDLDAGYAGRRPL